MANQGFFLGGVAEGIQGAQKQALAERAQTEDTGLRGRGLDIQEKQLARTSEQDVIKRVDQQIADTMAVVSETVKSAVAVGRPPEQILKAVQPLVQSAKGLMQRAGRDPNALDAQVGALLTSPTAVQTSVAAGTATAAEKVSQAGALKAAGVEPAAAETTAGIKSAVNKDQVTLENQMRDDYLKASKDYITIRDAKNRIDAVETTGAGDMALVFQYMKILDPNSTVREGEYATAVNAAGVPSAIQAAWNRLIGGGTLGDKARKDIRAEGERLYRAAELQHDNQTLQFKNIASRSGLNTNNVIIDLKPAAKGKSNERVPDLPVTAPRPGTVGTTPGGLKWEILR